ncbi:hypothetical protein ACIGW4_14450 [Streptomyces sp. NPDC053513]|uniref:hypothetical protein n=1 Tax=unclassified Streptomyces TaxID=2593676 RepID=UPI0037D5166E
MSGNVTQGGLGEPDADGVAYVCEHAEEIRRQLELTGDSACLDRLRLAVQEERAVLDLLEELHEAVLASGDALGVLGRGSRGVRPAGIMAARRESVFICPRQRRCSRSWWPREGSTVPPVCHIDEGAEVRLRKVKI